MGHTDGKTDSTNMDLNLKCPDDQVPSNNNKEVEEKPPS